MHQQASDIQEERKQGNKVQDDMLLVGMRVSYDTLLMKVFVLLEYAVAVGSRWILKTDDDAYVNVPQLTQVNLNICCTDEVHLLEAGMEFCQR